MTLSHLLHLTCNSAAAMHDSSNLETPLLRCSWASVYKRSCSSIAGYVKVPAMAAVHAWIGDLKMKQRVFMGTTLTDWLTDRWWTTRSRPRSAEEAIWSCWSSPQSPNSSGSQTRARGSGMCCKHCTLLYAEAGSYSVRKSMGANPL